MRITFTGDILIYESQDKGCLDSDKKRDYRPIFEQVKPLLDKADYVVGSFETTVAGEAAGYTHAATSFNTPDEVLCALKWSGIDLLTTANNHCFDRGEDGLRRTMKMIKESGLEFTGTRFDEDDCPYLIKDFGGTKIAFLAYTYGTNSKSNGFILPKGKEYLVNLTRPQDAPIAPIHRPLWKHVVKKLVSIVRKPRVVSGIRVDCVEDREVSNCRNELYELKMLETISKAKKEANIVIMCLHSGGQFNSKIGAYTNHLFNILASSGVDAIVCNHAHTVLPIYHQDNCIIASALGNFSFAPGEGYWVDGVKAEYSILFNLEFSDNKITSYSFDICKSVHNKNGLAVTIPVTDEEEKRSIEKRIIMNPKDESRN